MVDDIPICYYKYDPQEIESRMRKKKKVVVDPFQVGLGVHIRYAEEIDDPSLHSSVVWRHYCVVYWVEPGVEGYTRVVQGMLDPCWNEKDLIPLGNNVDDYAFLSVEVVRIDNISNPGPSSGQVLVGRAKIPLPTKLNRVKKLRVGLVRLEGDSYRPEGHISLSMELTRFRTVNGY